MVLPSVVEAENFSDHPRKYKYMRARTRAHTHAHTHMLHVSIGMLERQ